MTIEKKILILIPILLLVFYGLFLAHKTNLVWADLGRHIENGMLTLQNFDVLRTNYYSYTEPDYPTINHHWGSGVIFYLIYKFLGFSGLSIFFILISFITFLLFFRIAYRRHCIGLGALVALPIIGLLAERIEIRPEMFSYLFCAIFLFILWGFRDKLISQKQLFILPVLQIIWVNLHIYFFLGPLLIGVFLIRSLMEENLRQENSRALFNMLVFSVIACLVNPFGLAGASAPFTIFQNFGYKLAENQSVWFTEKYFGHSGFFILKIITVLLGLSFIPVLLKKKNFPMVNFFLAIVFTAMAWFAIRNIALFGFFALPILATNIGRAWEELIEAHKSAINIASLIAVLIIVISAITGGWQHFYYNWNYPGIGLEPNNSAAADFFKKEGLKGPIFNNYDIGGYLIFYLFPQEKVFVDNRPEAYSADFFQKVFIPMQEDNKKCEEQDKKYNFNSIFFSYKDITPWGQKFLADKIVDLKWAPVYVDQYSIIFLKRNTLNKPIIDKYEIPKERFKVSK